MNDVEGEHMKHQIDKLENKIKVWKRWLLSISFLFLTAAISVPITLAQEEPFMINGQEVEQYLKEKYKFRKDKVRSTLKQTPNGPTGYLYIGGGIVLKVEIVGEDKQERARTIAETFLKEEATLLGITDIREIRESRIETYQGYGGDYTQIRYKRYIFNNLELEGVDIRITIGPEETIRHMMAELVPVSRELYQAVMVDTLTEAKIRNIIEEDLKAPGIDLKDIKIRKIEKIAIPSHPYVIWALGAYVENIGGSSWNYRIDAFTGEILVKQSAIRYAR